MRTIAQPETQAEFIAALRALSKRTPTTRAELSELETESVALVMHVQECQSLDIPETVWHFLSDADIRFKSPEYARAQVAALESALVAMERQGAA